jgi:hypothetical protein
MHPRYKPLQHKVQVQTANLTAYLSYLLHNDLDSSVPPIHGTSHCNRALLLDIWEACQKNIYMCLRL